jgi:hypothetical protein
MKCYLLTESPTHAVILREILKPLFQKTDLVVVDGGEGSGSTSLARTLLVSRPAAVVLLRDSGTTDESRTANLKSDLLAALGSVASRRRFEILLAMPELEAVFFADLGALETALGIHFRPTELVEAKYRPKLALMKAIGEKNFTDEYLRRLVQKIGTEHLQGHPLVIEIIAFVENALGNDAPKIKKRPSRKLPVPKG